MRSFHLNHFSAKIPNQEVLAASAAAPTFFRTTISLQLADD